MSRTIMRSQQANALQRCRLMNIIQENPILITKQFSNEFTFDTYQSEWEQIKEQLNALGPKKEVKNWQKYLTDQKCRVKKKKSEVTRSARKTGGGQADVPDLPEEDEKLLAVMGGQAIIEGDASAKEFGFGGVDEIILDAYIEKYEEVVEDNPVPREEVSSQVQEWNGAVQGVSLQKMKENMTMKLKAAPDKNLTENPQGKVREVRQRKRRMTQKAGLQREYVDVFRRYIDKIQIIASDPYVLLETGVWESDEKL